MASKKDGGESRRLHYDYALTGNVPGVGKIGGTSLPKEQTHAKGGKVHKPRGRGR
jgi:hypothetical protein